MASTSEETSEEKLVLFWLIHDSFFFPTLSFCDHKRRGKCIFTSIVKIAKLFALEFVPIFSWKVCKCWRYFLCITFILLGALQAFLMVYFTNPGWKVGAWDWSWILRSNSQPSTLPVLMFAQRSMEVGAVPDASTQPDPKSSVKYKHKINYIL